VTGGPSGDASRESELAARLVAEVEAQGLLLLQDQVLPSATTLLAGEPIAGSWWAHPLAHPIYDALQVAYRDAVRVKLVAGKVTLVHRRRWPDLVAIGRARRPWQVAGLGPDVVALVGRAGRFREPVEIDELIPGASRAERRGVVQAIERRMLLHVDSIHTDSGAHGTVVEGWRTFQRRRGVPDELPSPTVARAGIEAIVRGWPGVDDALRLLPWGR
jgi:hypothetical protein